MHVPVGAAPLGFGRPWWAAAMKNEIPMASAAFGAAGPEPILTTPEEGNGIVACCGHHPAVDNPTNLETEDRRALPREPALSLRALRMHLGGRGDLGRRRARGRDARNMPVIEALESGRTYDMPAGQVSIHPKTHHRSATSGEPSSATRLGGSSRSSTRPSAATRGWPATSRKRRTRTSPHEISL